MPTRGRKGQEGPGFQANSHSTYLQPESSGQRKTLEDCSKIQALTPKICTFKDSPTLLVSGARLLALQEELILAFKDSVLSHGLFWLPF